MCIQVIDTACGLDSLHYGGCCVHLLLFFVSVTNESAHHVTSHSVRIYPLFLFETSVHAQEGHHIMMSFLGKIQLFDD